MSWKAFEPVNQPEFTHLNIRFTLPLRMWKVGEISPQVFRVGIIGSRDCSKQGSQLAAQLGDFCARIGVVVVSGNARGIDRAAELGCAAAGGRVLSLLAECKPSDEQLLAIVNAGGCLISGHINLEQPRVQYFERNNWIAGLSDILIAVECDKPSGTLHTLVTAAKLGVSCYGPSWKSVANVKNKGLLSQRDAGALQLVSTLGEFKQIIERGKYDHDQRQRAGQLDRQLALDAGRIHLHSV